MMLLAMIWFAIAPVSLLLPMWVIYKSLGALVLPQRGCPQWAEPHRLALLAGIAVVLVLTPVMLIWQMDHRAFVQVCQKEGDPVVLRTAQTDGFFLDDGTANSFGMRYLQTEGFEWMEARSIYKRDAFVRYTRSADGKISETEQATRTARYAVVGDFAKPHAYTSVQRTRIMDSQAPAGEQEMARAAMVRFDGGRLKWVLGVYATDSFPSAMSDTLQWQAAYYLVRNTLNPALAGKAARH